MSVRMTKREDEVLDMAARETELATIKQARKRVIRELGDGQIRAERAADLLDVLFGEERKVQEAILKEHWDRQPDA
jgi:hypothetical protein